MKALALAFGLVVLVTAPAASLQNAIRFTGNSWETGGFPDSNVGDELEAVGVVTAIVAPLFWSPSIYAYTMHVDGLISTGETLVGTTRVVEYAAGRIAFYVDNLPSNHDYGVNPPNATAPSTFTDGFATYLEGDFTSFTLTHNSANASGSFVGQIEFDGGNAYPQLQSNASYSIGANVANISPAGYDLQWNGAVFVDGPLGLENGTWSGVKSLYR